MNYFHYFPDFKLMATQAWRGGEGVGLLYPFTSGGQPNFVGEGLMGDERGVH